MAKGRARDLVKEATWRRRLDRQAASEQSVRAWCRRHRVKEAAFHWWRRELVRRDAEAQPAAFLPVHLAEEPAVNGDCTIGDRVIGNPAIEIVLTDGRQVRITGPVNREMLTMVLDVLERPAC